MNIWATMLLIGDSTKRVSALPSSGVEMASVASPMTRWPFSMATV